MVADYMENPDGFSMERWYEKHFGKNASEVHHAVELLCRGFREYPFSVTMVYCSPKNLGPANLWQWDAEQKHSNMVCYSFDDYEKWIQPYPLDVYLSQFEKVIADWSLGCEVLSSMKGNPLIEEMALFARVALLHFRSDLIHTRYASAKRDLTGNRELLLGLLREEREIAEELLALVAQSPLIGYETSNHYFYTERNLIEKLAQLEILEKQLQEKGV